MKLKLMLLILPIYLASCSSFQGARDVAQVPGGEVGNPVSRAHEACDVSTITKDYNLPHRAASKMIEVSCSDWTGVDLTTALFDVDDLSNHTNMNSIPNFSLIRSTERTKFVKNLLDSGYKLVSTSSNLQTFVKD